MALAFAFTQYFPPNRGVRERIVAVTMDGSYPVGGWPVTPANFNLAAIRHMECESVGGYVFEYDDAAAKIKAYWGDNNNAADGPLIEIPANDTGVNTKVVKTRVTGY